MPPAGWCLNSCGTNRKWNVCNHQLYLCFKIIFQTLNQTRFQIMLKVLRHVFWFFNGISLWNCKLWHSLLLLFLPPSLLSPAALCTVRQQYLLLWISFVLIIRINDCLAIWMPHLEKLGSHVTVINYRQAGASPGGLLPPSSCCMYTQLLACFTCWTHGWHKTHAQLY